jgi:hypothetical protein
MSANTGLRGRPSKAKMADEPGEEYLDVQGEGHGESSVGYDTRVEVAERTLSSRARPPAEQAALIAELRAKGLKQSRSTRVSSSLFVGIQHALHHHFLHAFSCAQWLFQVIYLTFVLAMLYCSVMAVLMPYTLEHQLRFKTSVSPSGFLFSYLLDICALAVAMVVLRVRSPTSHHEWKRAAQHQLTTACLVPPLIREQRLSWSSCWGWRQAWQTSSSGQGASHDGCASQVA